MSVLPPPPPSPAGPPEPAEAADPFSDLLFALAEDRVRDAASTRRRSYWLTRQSEQEGSFVGVLADLAERAEPVVCTTRSGRRHAGQLHALGADFVAVRGRSGALVLVSLKSVADIRTRPGAGTVAGDRTVESGRLMGDVLAELCGERPDVVVATGLSEVRGELRAVGRDLLTVRLDGQPPSAAYVALSVTDEVRVR